MNTLKLNIPNNEGITLATRLEQPLEIKPRAFAIFAHCFTCTKNIKAAINISRALARKGIATLRFDFTGLGESEGDFADTNFTSNVRDLIDVANYLSEHYEPPKLLIGHSLGGAAVLQAASAIDSIKAVVTIGAPSEPSHVQKLLSPFKENIIAQGEAEVTLAGRPFKIKRQFLDDLSQSKMAGTIQTLRKALLVMHSPIDNTVGIDNAAEIFTQARHPKSFVSLDDADHLLLQPAHSEYAGSLIAEWSAKYIETPMPSAPSKEKPTEAVVVKIGQNGLTTDIMAGGYALTADEPSQFGGNNQGPTPYEYCLSGLGACTAMTLKMYIERKKWNVEEIRVDLKHEKIHAEDCQSCETAEGKIDQIQRTITITGELTKDQYQRLLVIADKCPVHQTLQKEVKIDTKLADQNILR